MPPTDDPWQSCRFCLRENANDDMRTLPQNDLLPHTEVAQLFEEVTGSPLDFSPGYSELWCTDCEQRLRSAAQIRADFVGVAQRWQEIMLDGSLLVVKAEELSADDDDEENENALLFNGDFDTLFVNCSAAAPMADALQDDAGHPIKAEQVTDDAVRLVQKKRENEHANDQLYADWGATPSGVMWTCDMCGNQSATRSSLIKHMRAEHGPMGSKTCNICGNTFFKLGMHQRAHHRPYIQFKCSDCDKIFDRHFHLVQHELQHQRMTKRDRPFICDICGFVFSSNAGLYQHLRRHANNIQANNDDGTAPSFGKRIPTQQIFRDRVTDDKVAPTMRIKSLPTPVNSRIECPICKKLYAKRSSLQAHVRFKHYPDGLAEWKRYLATVCVVCNERCSSALALREHRRVHQPHECDICRRTFDTRITWELHTKLHTARERPHICDICQAQHSTPYALRLHHRRVHTDERPYQCNQCNLSFVDNNTMRKHISKKHVVRQRKSYVCRECPADAPPFTSDQTLRKHMELHTGVCRFRCKVCSLRQSSVSNLLEHMRQFHPDYLKDAVL